MLPGISGLVTKAIFVVVVCGRLRLCPDYLCSVFSIWSFAMSERSLVLPMRLRQALTGFGFLVIFYCHTHGVEYVLIKVKFVVVAMIICYLLQLYKIPPHNGELT